MKTRWLRQVPKLGLRMRAALWSFPMHTSPRGDDVPDDEAYDLGKGLFYVNATEAPWNAHFQMWDYVASELPNLLAENFGIDPDWQSITGHSMGDTAH